MPGDCLGYIKDAMSQVITIVQDLRNDVKAKREKLFVSDITQVYDLASGSEGEAAPQA